MSNQETKTYEVVKPIGWEGRHEKGEILEMPVSVAKAFGTEYVVEVTAKATGDDDTDSSDDVSVSKMNLKELQAKAEELGLAKTGSKADLQERIALKLQDAE
jgi:hypothetical protein